MHTSIPQTRMTAEAINVTPINPLISSCEIKVLYTGKNRNRSFISKEVATKMADSLPNIPIVGEYLEYEKDFGDHASETIIDSKGIRTVKRTVPYGVVPSDTQVVWKMFLDDDGVEREYMVCQGYLWTGRYPECARVTKKGNGQSMELDLESIKGKWATLENGGDEYFIMSDAIFSALCILGEDVEPCFEGASVTAPNVLYSLDKGKFTAEMSQFMLCLKEALNKDKGGTEMSDINKIIGEDPAKDFTAEGQSAENQIADNANNNDGSFTSKEEEEKKKEDEEDFSKKDDEDSKKEEEEDFTKKEDEEEEEDFTKKEDEKSEEEASKDDEEKKAKYTLAEVTEYTELLANFNKLQADFNALTAEYENVKPELFSLREMKVSTDRAKKEKMVAGFYMLDEADLKDVKDNMDNYSLEDIESKLSVIAVRKKVNFNLDDSSNSDTKKNDPIVEFSADTVDNTPAWLRAVDNVVKNKNI